MPGRLRHEVAGVGEVGDHARDVAREDQVSQGGAAGHTGGAGGPAGPQGETVSAQVSG